MVIKFLTRFLYLPLVSVEDILSYGVKKKYHSFRSKVVTPSGRVLQDLGKTLPEAAAIYDKCFNADSAAKEDYTLVHVFSAAERKIVWIRAALIEGKLQAIVESITSNPMWVGWMGVASWGRGRLLRGTYK